MNQDELIKLSSDIDGLISYEYLANNIESITSDDLNHVTDNIINIDSTGQFCASAARYINAIDAQKYDATIAKLVAATIEKDREHRYLADLISSLYGSDYRDKAEELSKTDNNFRRMYKRLYPNPESL